jgi:peptide/nickel transport system substrate-binding protein
MGNSKKQSLRTRRWVATTLTTLLMGTGLIGLASPGGASSFPTSHTLNLSFLQDPGQPPDPAVYYASEGLVLEDNVYDGLVQYAPDTAKRDIVPDLALSWTVSSDYKTYTFKLRQGVTFHDGTPFTSAAVGPSITRDANVDGGPAYMAQAVASVQDLGPYEVQINLSAPNASFLDYLASAYGPRIYSPTGLVAHAGSDFDQTYLATHDLGSGPYTLTEAQVGIMYQLKAYPGYWGKKPYYTTVNFPVIDSFETEEVEFNNGQIAAILHDLTTSAIQSYKKNKSVNVYTLPNLEASYLLVNPHKPLLATAANRRAVLAAINLKQIVSDVFPGIGSVATSAYPKNMVPKGTATQKDTFDPSVLQKLAKTLPASEKKFTIGYDTGSPTDELIASLLTDDFDQAGLSAQSIGYQTSTVFDWPPPGKVTANAPDVLIQYPWPDAYDPFQWAHIGWGDQGGVNILQCDIPGLDDQLNTALATGDVALFGKAGDEAAASGCWYNMANRNDVFVSHTWLKGLPQGHVVAYPYTVNLTALHPG